MTLNFTSSCPHLPNAKGIGFATTPGLHRAGDQDQTLCNPRKAFYKLNYIPGLLNILCWKDESASKVLVLGAQGPGFSPHGPSKTAGPGRSSRESETANSWGLLGSQFSLTAGLQANEKLSQKPRWATPWHISCGFHVLVCLRAHTYTPYVPELTALLCNDR